MLRMSRQIKKRETLVKVPIYGLGLGHATRLDVNRYLNGQSLRTYDVDLDQAGKVRQRSGIHYISQNGAGGEQITTFDEDILVATPGKWSESGSYLRTEEERSGTCRGFTGFSTVLLDATDPVDAEGQYIGRTLRVTGGLGAGQESIISNVADLGGGFWQATVTPAFPIALDASSEYVIDPLIRPYNFGGPSSKAKRLFRPYSGGGFAQGYLPFTAPMDLTTDDEEIIVVSIYVHDKSLIDEGSGGLRFELETTLNVDNFLFPVPVSGLKDYVTDGDGNNLVIFKKSDAAQNGAPDWTSIADVHIKCNFFPGGMVVFDNMWLGGKKFDGLFNFRQPDRLGGGNFKVAAVRGVISYYYEDEDRWVPLKTGLKPYVPVRFCQFTDWLYFMNGYDPVGVILGDGSGKLTAATTHTSGIDAPDLSSIGYVVGAAGSGNLPSGIHEYRLEFWSKYTGLPGTTGLDNILSIPATAADVKIAFSNLPVSTDTKVTKLRVYRRDATSGRFRRAVELDNGTTDWEDDVASLDLGVELEGYPQYVKNGPPPVLSMMAGVGDRAIAAGDPDAPAVIYVSAVGNAEQWDLATAPFRTSGDDPVKAVFAAFGAYAGAGKDRAVIIGDPIQGPSGFNFRQRSPNSGPVSQTCVVPLEDLIRYRSHDGYYAFGRNWQPRKISRDWDTGPRAASGIIEPTFEMFDNIESDYVAGAYFKPLGQILWVDKLQRDQKMQITSVYHVGHLETSGRAEKGPSDTWSFHRYALDDDLAGMTAISEYLDPISMKMRAMVGGTGGFVYDVEAGEFNDVMPNHTVTIKGNILFPFMGNRGVALGNHQQKDFVYHDLVMTPMGNWPLQLEYYFDWLYKPVTRQITPVGQDEFSLSNQPFLLTEPFYTEVGDYLRVELPSGRHRNVAWCAYNDQPGASFEISEEVWFIEYLGAEGAV